MTIPAHAATPDLEVPDVPDISDIKFDIKFKLPDGFWDKWFEEHPVPELKTNTPVISTAKYVHGSSRYNRSRLEIRWSEIYGADSYEVEITKADGSKQMYVSEDNLLYRSDVECPKVYIEETDAWVAATVRVRAVDGYMKSQWSEPVKISCNTLH